MKFLISLPLIFLFFAINSFGQVQHLYKLEDELMKGNKDALSKIAGYFDSRRDVVEYLGYHRIETKESDVAKRIADENCIFAKSEFVISPATTAKEFLNFLKLNKDKITFSPLADAFLLSPLENREVEFEIIELSPQKRKDLQERAIELFKPEWAKENGIDYLMQAKTPAVLLKIASLLFKERIRYNRYNFNKNEYIDLLQYLTGTLIAVKNEKNEFSYHIDREFYSDSQLNLLIFFAKFYKNYQWNSEQSAFVNPQLTSKPQTIQATLFDQLSNQDKSIAFEAFIKLTELNPETVIKLAADYNQADIRTNYSLPTFPYNFLRQLVLLTAYCRENGIDYNRI